MQISYKDGRLMIGWREGWEYIGESQIPPELLKLDGSGRPVVPLVADAAKVAARATSDAVAVLERWRAQTLAALEDEFSRRLSASFTHNGNTYSMGPRDRQNLRDANQAVSAGKDPIVFPDAAGNRVQHTAEEFRALVIAAFDRGQALEVARRTHEAQIMAAALANHDLTVGWP